MRRAQALRNRSRTGSGSFCGPQKASTAAAGTAFSMATPPPRTISSRPGKTTSNRAIRRSLASSLCTLSRTTLPPLRSTTTLHKRQGCPPLLRDGVFSLPLCREGEYADEHQLLHADGHARQIDDANDLDAAVQLFFDLLEGTIVTREAHGHAGDGRVLRYPHRQAIEVVGLAGEKTGERARTPTSFSTSRQIHRLVGGSGIIVCFLLPESCRSTDYRVVPSAGHWPRVR